MEIICPQCGFSRTVADGKVPAKSVFATCPKCRHKFRFRTLDEPEYEFAAEEAEAPAPAPPAPPAPPVAAEAAPPRPAPAPDPMPARTESTPPEPPAAAAVPDPVAPPAPPAAPRPDNRPVRRIVLRDEYPDEPAGPHPEPQQEPEQPSRSGDIWQKLENLAREESTRAEAKDPGVAPDGEPSGGVPWENLNEHGFFRGLWATIYGAAFHPGEFFRNMPTQAGGMAKPLSFYILLSMFATAAQTVWLGLFFDTLNQVLTIPPNLAQYLRFNLVQDVVGIAVLTPAVSILRIFFLSGLMHLGLRTMNAASGGFSGTLRAIAYTNATSILNLIPLVGMFLDLFWWMFVFLVALKETHRATYGRVLLAVHLPLFVVVLAMYVAAVLPRGA